MHAHYTARRYVDPYPISFSLSVSLSISLHSFLLLFSFKEEYNFLLSSYSLSSCYPLRPSGRGVGGLLHAFQYDTIPYRVMSICPISCLPPLYKVDTRRAEADKIGDVGGFSSLSISLSLALALSPYLSLSLSLCLSSSITLSPFPIC